MLQLVFSTSAAREARSKASGVRTLADLAEGEAGILAELDLPEEAARRLMVLGFLPGNRIEAGPSAPGGDPRIYRVDGAEIALRAETAACLKLASDDQDAHR
ncbi:MAG: FeoA family protein [Bryobacterales bacterium]|nr:ferrous iron transport protein A [Bryobacteraceae bacterium]MDW8129446.1 FeoA family protein [Bryobacterales bacterium]